MPVALFFAAPLVALLAGCGPASHDAPWAGNPDSIPSAYAHAGAALMWPGATRAFQVRADGSLYNGAWRLEIRPSANGTQAGPPHTIAYEDRWLPIAHWRRASGEVRWDFEAVPFPAPGPADTALLVSLDVRATNLGRTPAAGALGLDVKPSPADAGWVALDAPAAGAPIPTPADLDARFSELGGGGKPAFGFTLAPGESHAWRVLLSADRLPHALLARLGRTAHGERAAACRHYWIKEVSGGLQLALGDPEIERAMRAARVVLLSCRERHGGRWLPTGGPFQYHDIWLRDGARAIAALAVAGHTRVARELADGITVYQWPQGAFLSQRSQPDGNGQALWAFAQAMLRPAPDTTVARYAVLALRACQWIDGQRSVGLASHWPFGAQLPYAEPRDGELVRAQLVGNDAWSLAAFESAARLLRAAGRADDATRADSAHAIYAAEFAAALARTHDTDVPPSWQGIGRDWGNLAAPWPCRALAPGDPRCAALAARVWRASAGEGLACYGSADSLHGYVGADLGTWALLAGRPETAGRVLDALLRWRDATGGAAELFSGSQRDYGRNFPPHPTSAAALIALTRNSLVYDDGDTLQLTLGAHESWWRGAKVSGASTRWGTIELAFERRGDNATWRWSPVPVWTTLTLPPGAVLAAPPPAPLSGARGGTIVLAPPGSGIARAALTSGAGARP